MKKFINVPFGAVLAFALAGPAMAQDASVERNWSGPYVGGSIGLAKPDHDSGETLVFDTDGDGQFDNSVTSGGSDIFTGYCSGRSASGAAADGCVNDRTGTNWAGIAGYDMQFGNIVAGVVAEGGIADVTDGVTGFSDEPGSYTLNRRLKENAALRARVGYAMGNTLLYATGGGAYGRINNRFSTTNTANDFADTGNSNAWGWTAGGGVEQRIADNFSIGLLYKYTSLDPKDYDVTVTQGSAPATGPFTNTATTSGQTLIARGSDKFNYHTGQVTATYRF
ncbi:outer membrane protein [Rhizorhapis sp. SPR117]|uniref:outer membrane protein n=1 Tax=Rhizorhapis sp. SPR117 TaxID=2912611 RepID=UPI001F37E2D3|nr:outer membrane beta-barrel protein [Rhizorhapis sp. SPR117]